MLQRRGLLLGLLAAPAVIRTPGLLMPVKKVNLVVDRSWIPLGAISVDSTGAHGHIGDLLIWTGNEWLPIRGANLLNA